MVSQLLKISLNKPSFDYIKDIYEPCLKRYRNNKSYRNWQDAQNAIEKERKILESDDEIDTYIAFYGAHDYYKLVKAFDALDMLEFCDRQLEIFSYGCGAATDTCSLIAYLRRFQLRHKSNKNLDAVEIALNDGSLLIMKGSTQHFWKHQVPKTSKLLKERINLTVRVIN